MTITFLTNEIANIIREKVKDYNLIAENQPNKKVSVYDFDIPYGDSEIDSYVPYVIVSPKMIDLVERDSIATISIMITTYSGMAGNDWRDMLSISERIRQAIYTNFVIAEKYLWNHTFNWQPVTVEQPSPFIIGYIETDYRIATPEPAFIFPRVKEN